MCKELDRTENKAGLGANAIMAVSIAVCMAGENGALASRILFCQPTELWMVILFVVCMKGKGVLPGSGRDWTGIKNKAEIGAKDILDDCTSIKCRLQCIWLVSCSVDTKSCQFLGLGYLLDYLPSLKRKRRCKPSSWFASKPACQIEAVWDRLTKQTASKLVFIWQAFHSSFSGSGWAIVVSPRLW